MIEKKTLEHLNRTTDNCPQAEIVRQWLKGDFTLDECAIGIAVLESERCSAAQPRPFPILTASLRDYCEGRIVGRVQYDFGIAKRLGSWFSEVRKALEFNSERFEHYAWAAARIESLKAGNAYERVSAARDRFARAISPGRDLELCLKAKAIDSEERESKKKNG